MKILPVIISILFALAAHAASLTLNSTGFSADSASFVNGGIVITNSATTQVGLTVNGLSGQTNDTVKINSGGTNHWRFDKDGKILPATDVLFDIGSSALRTRAVYTLALNAPSGSATLAGTSTAGLIFNAVARISSPANGVLTFYNQALSDFSRVCFGGITTAFPSIKRNGPALNIRNGDDTGDAVLTYLDQLNVGSAATLDITNRFYLVNVDAQTVTLPTAVGVAGKSYSIKTITPASTATVATTSSQLIDGAATYSLSASNKFVRVTSDGTNWWVFGSN